MGGTNLEGLPEWFKVGGNGRGHRGHASGDECRGVARALLFDYLRSTDLAEVYSFVPVPRPPRGSQAKSSAANATCGPSVRHKRP